MGRTEPYPLISPHETIGDHYLVERELGHGGMANVYLCTDTRTGEKAAVKVLRPELASVVARERFFREIEFSSQLTHPRIPRLLESGVVSELPYYAMTYVEGESLRQKIRRDSPIPIGEMLRIVRGIADPVGFAHARGIVHRDIKPDNIVLCGDEVHVLDFGVARAIVGAGGDRLTRTGITVGSPAYMSPEQVMAERDIDWRSDVYSLGCVVYEMLSGSPPFRGATPQVLMSVRLTSQPMPLRSRQPGVPEHVAEAVSKAMARSREQRWNTVEDFVAALENRTSEPAAGIAESGNGLQAQVRAMFSETYEVEEEMKGGGMSRLFLATDLALRRKVVIKILPPDLVSPMMLARFQRESEVTARLQHPHILPVISAGVRDGLAYYVMPLLAGESLRASLERQGRLPIPDAFRLLREITDALAYAHRQGVVHRDIKPENILIQDGHAVLADFGIAAALSGSGPEESGQRLTATGMSLGTVGYMAPEQALGERNVDARADIYAVGVVGYEMLAGAPPFSGATDQAILVAHLTKEPERLDVIRPDVPAAAVDAIAKALEKDPASRFETAAEFRDALEAAAGTPPRAVAPVPVTIRRSIPRRWQIGVPAAILAALAIFAVSSWLGKRPASVAHATIPIAIAPFNTPSSGLELWREGMVDLLARNFDGAGPLRTISPTVSIRGFPPVTDRNSATALARRTNATYAIFGTIVGSANDSVRLRGTLVDIERDVVTDFEIRDSTVEAAAGRFTIDVLNELGKTHTIGAVRQSSFGSGSVDAVRAFLQGEQLFRRTSWDSAALSYERAIGFDAKFAIARRRLAQVVGWQQNGSDSLARAHWLEAGALNHGVSPRDSLLLLADSLSAALAPLPSDSMNWAMLRRLFATVNDAATRYPDDPEVWYGVGEARFHLGYGSPVNITEQQALEAFDKSIELDSAFAPAYVHAVELAFTLHGIEAGLRYTRAYLQLRPTDDEAEGISIVDRVARARGRSSAAADSVLDDASSDAIMAAYYAVRRWPDSAQTALRLLQSTTRRSRSSGTFAEDSIRLWNFMPLQLAYRGRLSEAYLALGNRPSRIFVELALLDGIPADTVSAVLSRWIAEGRAQAFFTLPLLAERGDSVRLRLLAARADAAARTGSEFSRRGARYRSASARAYLSLVRRDTADALRRFTALPDTLCIACYLDRLQAAQLLASRGRLEEAHGLLDQRLNSFITPAEVLIAVHRGRVASRLGKREEASSAWQLVEAAWTGGDPVLQPYVAEARAELRKLGAASRRM